MIQKTYLLKDLSEEFKDSDASLVFYELEYAADWGDRRYPRPGLVILPGGAYKYCSDREAEPIALRMLTEGFNCFVLRYTCSKKYPTPQKEVVFLLNYIREHYQEFSLLDINLSIVGFSAGAHLTASIGAYYKEIAESLNIKPERVKPLALILGYPVITSNPKYWNELSIRTISNDEPELMEKMSLEKHVTSDYPPTYIFSTKDDTCVPVQKSELMIEALKKNNIPYKADLFETGYHGGSLFSRGVYYEYDSKHKAAEPNSIWVKEATKFVFDIVYK